MSGNVDSVHLDEIGVAELTKKVMTLFDANEETAGRIIAFSNTLAMDKMRKWISNTRKARKEKAEEIYKLTKKIKMSDLTVMGFPRYCKVVNDLVSEIEKKILEMCVES